MHAWAVPLVFALVTPTATETTPIQTPQNVLQTPAARYGRLDRGTCEAELQRRHVPFYAIPSARGVLAPVRLTGPMHGVTYHTALPAAQRATSPWEIMDCRLALALDDFSAILEKHDVVEVIHFSAYRPPSTHSTRAEGRQHEGALAIDAGVFKRKDGSVLQVERDFHGRIGAPTCGPGAVPNPATAEAIALRNIACEAAQAHLFNVELTPDYNYPHRNHFHLEVNPSARWFLVH
jgi:hypothetical protein